MKTRITLLLIITTLVTLSFTFSAVNRSQNVKDAQKTSQKVMNEPVGGFISEDKF